MSDPATYSIRWWVQAFSSLHSELSKGRNIMVILDLFQLWFWNERGEIWNGNHDKEVLFCEYNTYHWGFYVRVADPNHEWNPMRLVPMMCRQGNEYGYCTVNPFKSEGMRRLFEEAKPKELQRRKGLIVQYVTL